MNPDPKPRITIAIPVHNDGEFLRQSVESAVQQTNTLVLYDNASTDGTEGVCKDLVRDYPGIRYVRHAENKGAISNFKAALDAAETEYFMWLSAHDKISEGYTNALIHLLDQRSQAVLAFSPVHHIDRTGNELNHYEYDFAAKLAVADPLHRVLAMVEHLTDCSMMHGVFRTSMLRQAWFQRSCIGMDNVMLCRAAALGELLYNSDVWYERRKVREIDSPQDQLRRIDPSVTNGDGRLFEPMLIAQWEIIASLTSLSNVSHLYWKEKARWQMVNRFGYFSLSGFIGDRYNRLVDGVLGLMRATRKALIQHPPVAR